MGPLLLLLILPITSCSIKVEITASGDTSTATASGRILDVISDKERQTFGLTDDALKTGAERWSGGRPQDVFVKSPTPWNDLYRTYGWQQVTRILQPTKTKILDVRSEPVTVSSKEFVNNSTVTTTFIAGISQEVYDTVTSTWSTGHELTVGQSITYKVKMGFGSVSGESSVSYSSTWEKSVSESRTLTVGSEAGVEVTLEPGQAVVSTLTATRGSMVVEIYYDAKLSGSVACNYPRRYKGHHFWSYGINNIMRAIELPTAFGSKETVMIGFYSNARIVVNDLKTRKVLHESPVEIISI